MNLSPITEKNSFGLTLIELVTVIGILVFLIFAAHLLVNPVELQARGRDERRFTDMVVLDRAVNEYKLDAASFPDVSDTTRYSNTLPSGNFGPLVDPTDGWINVNLVQYMIKLPVDPINEDIYIYSYRHTQFGYELNAVLEYYTDKMVNDGGDDNAVYELGNDLTIL